MPCLPRNFNDAIEVSDWLELNALAADDGNASISEMLRALHFGRHDNGETTSLEVMEEIKQREIAAGDSYPFIIQSARVIQTKAEWKDHIACVFCLCLSYFKWKLEKNAAINPWNLFEELSCIVAAQYVQGKVFKLDARMNDLTGFGNAVSELCRQIGEGQGFKQRPTLNRKDDKVDLVAWKDFPDKMSSKLIMFGQCAAGENWNKKLDELQPQRFWDQWMADAKTSPLIRSFYIPHRIPRENWQYYARRAGILFDRCRIAHWAWSANERVVDDSRYLQ